MPNHLASETSPYLRQHRNNPVNWYPWGTLALQRARREDKPIFLSIGYSACHWCHVMEEESFENLEISGQLNEHFVCIKVDREERPDLDQIYMNAVQLLTGRGGWPMSVFLTPTLEPFFGGTYWPPSSQPGRPGFDRVLEAITDAWKNKRQQITEQAHHITTHVRQSCQVSEPAAELNENLIVTAANSLENAFDFTNGGFGKAPKFPHSMDLQLLLRAWRRSGHTAWKDMVRLNLDRMASGGIYDHLGGGFARYSVDDQWLVPHFEKMLYDNALLVNAYLDGYLATGHANDARIVHETLTYVLNYMTDEQGGFYSSEDADSEGVEGKFYLWQPAEVCHVLGGPRGERFCRIYDVTATGNFEGQNILHLSKTITHWAAVLGMETAQLEAELNQDRKALLAVRDRRTRPERDNKILTSWNGLMIDAMARAAAVLNSERYLHAAQRAAEFLLHAVRSSDGRLLHSWCQGKAKLNAYLDDYSHLIHGLTTLFETTQDTRWLGEALQLTDVVHTHFVDPQGGGFFYTSDDHETVITRNKEIHDASVPSSNGMLAAALFRLGAITGQQRHLDAAQQILSMASGSMSQTPRACGQLLLAADLAHGPFYEIVLAGKHGSTAMAGILGNLRQRFFPNRILVCYDPSTPPVTALDTLCRGKTTTAEQITAYICQNRVCQSPCLGEQAICAAWEDLAPSGIDRRDPSGIDRSDTVETKLTHKRTTPDRQE